MATSIHPWLSRTSKMPGYSFSIPAAACVTGAKLVDVPNSICSKCYALRGHYNYPTVQQALRRRNEALQLDPDFVSKMTELLSRVKNPYFRWFDSGDIPNPDCLGKIVQIAENLPKMYFWLPTKEHKWVRNYFEHREIPPNLIIRLSALIIDGRPPKSDKFLTSTTHRKGSKIYGIECSAPRTDGNCGQCRACWDPGVDNVSYGLH